MNSEHIKTQLSSLKILDSTLVMALECYLKIPLLKKKKKENQHPAI